MTMPAAATFVLGTVGTIPTVTGGGYIPPGNYYLIKQIVSSGTPTIHKIVAGGTDTCFTAIEIDANMIEQRFSGTVSYNGSTSTTNIMCPITLSVSPAYQVLAPIGGKVHYATLAPGGADYREWLQE